MADTSSNLRARVSALLANGQPAANPSDPYITNSALNTLYVGPLTAAKLDKTGDATNASITLPGQSAANLALAISPVVALGIARSDIPNRVISAPAFRVSGFAARGDAGSGAPYMLGSSTGPMAIQDKAGTWFQLDLGAPSMQASWFGVVPNVLTAVQAAANRVGLNLAKAYLTTGRTLYLPAGKIAIAPDPNNVNAPAWELGDGTVSSLASTAGWSVLPSGGYATPHGGELGGPGGTEFVAVGTWGTGPMFRLNGPIPGVDIRLSLNCSAGLAPIGVDVVHAFRSHLDFEVQGYSVNGVILRTINGPLFNGLTQGFMECEGRITTTLPANRTAEGVVMRAYEATVAKGANGYFYQGFSRNCFRIKAEIPGAAGYGAVVVDRIDNNVFPMTFTYVGGNGADAGSGGLRFIPSSDVFFPCENTFIGGHILGGMIGTQGSGGNSFPNYSVSDGEAIPTAGVWSTPTGLYGGLRRLYGDDSGSITQPTYTFNSGQSSGLSLVPAGGGVALSAGGVLGLQCDTAGRVGLGIAPIAGYGATINGDVNLTGGSRTVAASQGSYLQLQAPSTVYLTTNSAQQVTITNTGMSVVANGTFGGTLAVTGGATLSGGATIGSDVALTGGSRTISVNSGSYLQLQAPSILYLTTNFAQQAFVDASGIYPAVTNARDLGKSASQQWRNLYLQNAVTVNSDAKLKDEVSDIPESVLRAVRNVRIKRYKLKQSIAEKGSANARWHVGVIAQDIAAAFAAEGEDAFAWSVLCRDLDTQMVAAEVADPSSPTGTRTEYTEQPVLDADGNQTSTLSVRYDEWQNLVMAAMLAGN